MTAKTKEHLSIAKRMPRKRLALRSLENTKEGKAELRRVRKRRKQLADMYRRVRNDPEHGPHIARIAHRSGYGL